MSVEGTRYGHAEGRVSLVYGSDCKVYTAGMDGEMRIWSGIDDDDCENFSIGEQTLAIAVSKDKIFVSTAETNNVTSLNLEGDYDGVVTKFTADVTCLDIHESGSVIAAGSADTTIKVTNTTTFSDKLLSGHQAPILSVSLDPKKKFCCSSSCDGSVKVWDICDKKVVYEVDCVPKSNDVTSSKTVCAVRFSPSGNLLAIPKSDGKISVLNRETWEENMCLTDKRLDEKELFTCVTFSRNESILMAGTSKGHIYAWAVSDGKLLNFVKTDRKYQITSMASHPSKTDEVCFADCQGYWGLVSQIGTGSNRPSRNTDVSEADDGDLLSQDDLDELFNGEDEDENSFSISKIQESTGFKKDDEGHLVHEQSNIFAADSASSRPDSVISDTANPAFSAAKLYKPEPVRLQSTFQPASSPDHFNFRFLVYNNVGIVKTIQDNNIDVDFHDNETHYNLFFPNTENYSMAALTDKILVLAREGDEEVTGKVTVTNFKNSETKNDWSVDLSEGETVDCVAAGDGWVAAGSNKNYLRLFTAWGVQREILSVAGSIVSMVGSADKLFLVIHNSHPLPKQHYLSYYVIDVNFKKGLCNIVGPDSLPVSPDSELFWIGISDTMLPVSTDSLGIVRMLYGRGWYVICDTKSQIKGKSDTFFVTCIDHKDYQIRGIKCRGSRYPQTLPKPSPSSIPIELPFCITGERGGYEQRLMQSLLLAPVLSNDPEAEASAKTTELQCYMKLFALACRSDQDHRAIELCKLMPNLEAVQMAIQYASQMKKKHLVEKLGEVALNLEVAEQKTKEIFDEEKIRDSDEESQDMFESSQAYIDNPLLKARNQTSSIPNNSSKVALENRNPFARKGEDKLADSKSVAGAIVFDNTESVPKKKILIKQKPLLSVENKAAQKKALIRTDGKGELKGFQLYLAENKEMFPGTPEQSQSHALLSWKSMEKQDKEKYALPRMPTVKRKRSEEEVELEKADKKCKQSIKSKLAAFSAL